MQAGETVRFRMTAHSTEIHNVVFGPDDFLAQTFPASKSVTFTKPGTHGFICTVHGPSMSGTIEVS